MSRSPGFSLIELLVAMAIMVTVSGALMSLILAGESIARTQPEAADLQQLARVALQTLGAELALAGAGLDRGPQAGSLVRYFAPIVPSADGGVTVWYISSVDAQATLANPLSAGATDALLQNGGTCAATAAACAFSAASTAIVFDTHGCHDLLRVDDVTPVSLQVRAAPRGCDYPAGTAIAQGEVRTYRVDPALRQLVRRDEATGATVPVLDNVVSMSVEILDAGRRVRVTLRLTTSMPMPTQMAPDFTIAYEVAPPNLQR